MMMLLALLLFTFLLFALVGLFDGVLCSGRNWLGTHEMRLLSTLFVVLVSRSSVRRAGPQLLMLLVSFAVVDWFGISLSRHGPLMLNGRPVMNLLMDLSGRRTLGLGHTHTPRRRHLLFLQLLQGAVLLPLLQLPAGHDTRSHRLDSLGELCKSCCHATTPI